MVLCQCNICVRVFMPLYARTRICAVLMACVNQSIDKQYIKDVFVCRHLPMPVLMCSLFQTCIWNMHVQSFNWHASLACLLHKVDSINRRFSSHSGTPKSSNLDHSKHKPSKFGIFLVAWAPYANSLARGVHGAAPGWVGAFWRAKAASR